jgi:hypothetical protein
MVLKIVTLTVVWNDCLALQIQWVSVKLFTVIVSCIGTKIKFLHDSKAGAEGMGRHI